MALFVYPLVIFINILIFQMCNKSVHSVVLYGVKDLLCYYSLFFGGMGVRCECVVCVSV